MGPGCPTRFQRSDGIIGFFGGAAPSELKHAARQSERYFDSDKAFGRECPPIWRHGKLSELEGRSGCRLAPLSFGEHYYLRNNASETANAKRAREPLDLFYKNQYSDCLRGICEQGICEQGRRSDRRPRSYSIQYQAAFAIGSLTSSLFFSSLFFAFATGAEASDFFAGLPYWDSLSNSASNSACRTATFSINLSVALSRNAASSSMLSESRSIFAMRAPVFFWLPGRCTGHKDGAGLIHRER